MTQKQFEKKLSHLANIKRHLNLIETEQKPLKEEEAQLKFDIIRHLQEVGSRKTDPINGFYVTRVAGQSVQRIVDQDKAWEWLQDNHLDLEAYTKLDEAKIIETLAEDGEVVDFVETVTGAEHLSVKEAK